MIKKSIYWLLAVAALASSCERNKVPGTAQYKEISLNVSMNTYGVTRGVEHATEVKDPVKLDLEKVVVSTYNEVGAAQPEEVQNYVKFIEVDNPLTENYTEYKAVVKVGINTKEVKVDFNVDGAKLTSNVNSRQGSSNDAVVMVSGRGAVNGDVADLVAKPEMARIQIIDDIRSATIPTEVFEYKNLTLQAVYINRTIITRGGEKDRTGPNAQEWGSDFSASGLKPKLYTELKNDEGNYNCLITDADGKLTLGGSMTNMSNIHFFSRDAVTSQNPKSYVDNNAEGESVGFNLFAQGTESSTATAAKEQQPHLILKIGYSQKAIRNEAKEIIGWMDVDVVNGLAADDKNPDNNYSYINIVAYQSGASIYPAFEAGKVYELSMLELLDIFMNPEVNPTDPTTPDPDGINLIKMTISVDNWKEVNVEPEFPELPFGLPSEILDWIDNNYDLEDLVLE